MFMCFIWETAYAALNLGTKQNINSYKKSFKQINVENLKKQQSLKNPKLVKLIKEKQNCLNKTISKPQMYKSIKLYKSKFYQAKKC